MGLKATTLALLKGCLQHCIQEYDEEWDHSNESQSALNPNALLTEPWQGCCFGSSLIISIPHPNRSPLFKDKNQVCWHQVYALWNTNSFLLHMLQMILRGFPQRQGTFLPCYFYTLSAHMLPFLLMKNLLLKLIIYQSHEIPPGSLLQQSHIYHSCITDALHKSRRDGKNFPIYHPQLTHDFCSNKIWLPSEGMEDTKRTL